MSVRARRYFGLPTPATSACGLGGDLGELGSEHGGTPGAGQGSVGAHLLPPLSEERVATWRQQPISLAPPAPGELIVEQMHRSRELLPRAPMCKPASPPPAQLPAQVLPPSLPSAPLAVHPRAQPAVHPAVQEAMQPTTLPTIVPTTTPAPLYTTAPSPPPVPTPPPTSWGERALHVYPPA